MRKNYKKLLLMSLGLMAFGITGCGQEEEQPVTPAVNTTSTIGDITENTLKLSMNGSITEISCENFQEEGIAAENLEQYITNEIDTYNETRGASKITLVEYKEEDGVVKTAIQYSDLDTYNDFNNTDLEISVYNKAEVERLHEEDVAAHPKPVVYVEKTEVSEEELAAAGYSREDIEKMQETGSTEIASDTDAVATFTDASSDTTVTVDDISGDTYMMLTTEMNVNVIVNGGNVLYLNKYAQLDNENTADLSGEGTAIVVYKYNY